MLKCFQFSEFKQLLDFSQFQFLNLNEILDTFQKCKVNFSISNDGFRNNRTILNDSMDVTLNSLFHDRHQILIKRCGVDLTS